MGLLIIISLIIALLVINSILKASRRKTLLKAQRETMINEARTFLSRIECQKALTPISTGLMLKKGEDAYLEGVSSLSETRSVRHYQGGGAGFRIAKGVYIGGGGGTSTSIPEMTKIDTGNLVVTNKRLVFDGSTQDRTIPLDKIMSVNSLLDAIEVSSENRQKSMYFTVPNPLIWAAVIRILSSVPNPKGFSNVNVDIKMEH